MEFIQEFFFDNKREGRYVEIRGDIQGCDSDGQMNILTRIFYNNLKTDCTHDSYFGSIQFGRTVFRERDYLDRL